MKIFISWSGDKSREIANVTSRWVKFIFPSVGTWISTRDISAGDRSMAEIEEGLKGAEFGIICVTPDNQNANWINFEAGAISRAVGGVAKVAPLIDGFRSMADLKGPLAQFQTSLADQAGFRALAKGVNKNLSEEHGRSADDLQLALDLYWPQLESELAAIRTRFSTPGSQADPVERTQEDMLEEVLVGVRDLQRKLDQRHSARSDLRHRESSVMRSLAGEVLFNPSQPTTKMLADFLLKILGPTLFSGVGVNEVDGHLEAIVHLTDLADTLDHELLRSEVMSYFPTIQKVTLTRRSDDGTFDILD